MTASNGISERRARRRADAQPYAPRGRRADAAAANNHGLLSRLFGFLPLVGKLVTPDDDDHEDVDDLAIMEPAETSTELGHEDDEEDDKEDDEEVERVREETANAEEAPAARGRTTSPTIKTTLQSPPRAIDEGPRVTLKKRGPVTSPRSLGHGAESTKVLKIADKDTADGAPVGFTYRRAGRRRSKPTTSQVIESPLAVLKQRKPISYEEYERLSGQLRSLVAPTPDNALALTRSALSTALEPPTRASMEDIAPPPASTAAPPSTATSSKRLRMHDNGPISLLVGTNTGTGTSRKPRPSRLLTGAKKDAGGRSAYSAAVAEKILSTLNKIQSPLELETQRPTPATSLSWAKYHLAMTKERAPQPDVEPMEHEDLPPTAALPKVAFASPARPTTAPSPVAAPRVQFPTISGASPLATPSSSKPRKAATSGAPLSPPVVSMTPAGASAAAGDGTRPVTALAESMKRGEFSFTLPTPVRCVDHAGDDMTPELVYLFAPPPALREPPMRAPSQKPTSLGAATPFSFLPASPKTRPESLTKSTPAKKPTPPAKTPTPPTTKPKPTPAAGDSSSGSGNPLARFMTLAEGSWKCPTCAVTNGPTLAKCPCCETDRPGKSKPTTPASASATKTPAGVNPLARFMTLEAGSWKCPTCAVTNGAAHAKCPCCETDKPGASTVAAPSRTERETAAPKTTTAPKSPAPPSAGFSFGVSSDAGATAKAPSFTFGAAPVSETSAESKTNKALAVPAAPASGGFSFGVPSAVSSAAAPTPTPSFGAKSTGFTFGAALKPIESAKPTTEPSTTSTPPSGGFTFGKAGAGEASSSSSATTTAPTTLLSTKRKASNEDEPSAKRPESTPSAGFVFGATPTTSSGADKTPASVAAGDAVSMEPSTTEAPKKAPGFTFGSEFKPPSTAGGFTFGATSAKAPAAAESKPETATGEPTFSFGSSGATPAAPSFGGFSSTESKPVEAASTKPFTFGSDATKEKEGPSAKPAFSFGSTEPAPAAASEPKPAFSFGGAPMDKKSSVSKDSPPQPSFTFGSASSSTSFGSAPAAPASSTLTSAPPSKPSFTFGASPPAVSDSSSGAPAASTFSFSSTTVPSSTSAMAKQPSFTFGSSEALTPAAPTATAPATSVMPSSSPFTFGTPAGAAKPSTDAFGSGSGFGATPSTSGFGSSSGFGPTPTEPPATSTAFGGASAFGQSTGTFGTSAPAASSTFGTGAFNATPAPAFGSTPAPTPSFGSSGSTGSAFTFGSTAPTSSAPGSSSTQPAFGFGSAASSTFATPTTDIFSTSTTGGTTTGFGAGASGTGFGASTSTTGFGGSTSGFTGAPSALFGASPAPSFGSSSAASTPAFGGFGSAPSPAFGAPSPAPAFGAPAAAPSQPAFGGFGQGAPAPAAADGGGFAVGQAPKRRILKARSSRGSKRG